MADLAKSLVGASTKYGFFFLAGSQCVFGHIVSHFSFPTTSLLSSKVLSFSAQISGCLHHLIIYLFQGVAFAQQWSSAAAFGSLERADVFWKLIKILYTPENWKTNGWNQKKVVCFLQMFLPFPVGEYFQVPAVRFLCDALALLTCKWVAKPLGLL